MRLDNKVALVTSSTRGIGFASALKLAQYGATVYLGVRRVNDTQEICDKYPELNMIPIYFDAYEEDTYKSVIDEIIEKEGKIDILVNNFGTSTPNKDLASINTEEEYIFSTIKANVGTVFSISKNAIPHMIENGGGSIINISSIGGVVPDISRIAYGVSKSAVNNITKQMAMQYARYGIRVNAVLPGMTTTEAVSANMPEEFQKSFLSHVPLNRMGTPEDIANAVYFFASDLSSYITGDIMEVSGGYALGTPQYSEFVGSKLVK